MTSPKILALDTGLFGDAETMRQAVAQLPGNNVIPLVPAAMSGDDWDKLLGDIMAADKIITV